LQPLQLCVPLPVDCAQLVVEASQVRVHAPEAHFCENDFAPTACPLQLPDEHCCEQEAPLQSNRHEPTLHARSQVEPGSHVAVHESTAVQVKWHVSPAGQLQGCCGVQVAFTTCPPPLLPLLLAPLLLLPLPA
jgi:hypothetical protein